MKAIYICSVGKFSGKSLTGLVLALHLRDQGFRVGYFKPVGTLPHEVGGELTDEDALFIAGQLGSAERPADLCPVLFTPDLVEAAFSDRMGELTERVRAAYARVATDRDVVVTGGVGDLARGSLIGLSASTVAEVLDARVVLVAKYESNSTVEDVLLAQRVLGERLAGVVLNFVPPPEMERLGQEVAPYLERHGLPVLGIVPLDEILASITVRELASQLSAKVLCGEKGLDLTVGKFIVGAMGVASAARYFREVNDKAVITGGDRPDIQLAALQTSTRALVLTGNLYPSPVLVGRAQQLGVPMLLVVEDTLATVERIDRIMGRLRVREAVKVVRARELLEAHIDFARLEKLVGLAPVNPPLAG